MTKLCENSPIFIGGGVLISHIGNDVPNEVKQDIENLKLDSEVHENE